MAVRIISFSFRYAEQILNSKLNLKTELESIIYDSCTDLSILSRPKFNAILDEQFQQKGWNRQASIFPADVEAYAKLDFLKERIGVEVQFGHASFIGIDLLKFQIASYSNLDNIDLGIYICTTKNMQKYLNNNYNLNWNGSLTFEKVKNYLPHIKSAIQVPVYLIGIDI